MSVIAEQTSKPQGRPCRICTHEKNTEIEDIIEQRLLSGSVIDFRNISETYGMAISSVSRHVSDHLKLKLKQIVEERRTARAINVHDEFLEQLDFAKKLRGQAELLVKSVDANDRKFAVDAIKVTDLCIDKFAKLSGEYTVDKQNPADLSTLADVVKRYRADVIEQARIFEGTNGKFGAAMPTEAEMRGEIERLCRHQKVDYAKLENHISQQDLGKVG